MQGRVNSPNTSSGEEAAGNRVGGEIPEEDIHRRAAVARQAVGASARGLSSSPACEKSHAPPLDLIQNTVKAINKHRLC